MYLDDEASIPPWRFPVLIRICPARLLVPQHSGFPHLVDDAFDHQLGALDRILVRLCKVGHDCRRGGGPIQMAGLHIHDVPSKIVRRTTTASGDRGGEYDHAMGRTED